MHAPNFDAMTRAELSKFDVEVRYNPIRTARGLFPLRQPGYVRAARDLANYASNKAAAMLCREIGTIDSALMYEGICDRIYDGLPDFARW